MPRFECRPLRVSQRSNALQFYNRPGSSLNDSIPSKSRSYYLYTDPRPYEPPTKKYGSSSPSPSTPAPGRHRQISSLVTPFVPLPAGKRTGSITKKQDRNSASRLNSSAASIRSITSSILSRMRKCTCLPTLGTLPSELLYQIFSYLDQSTLLSLVRCSRRLMEEALYNLYEAPRFATTYRFAQFVTTITHDRQKAWIVKVLDVSNLGPTGAVEDEQPLAGWREWKFRNDPLHTIRREDISPGTSGSAHGTARSSGAKTAIKASSTHPLPSPFLQRYGYIRDIPIGAVLHVLAACPFLKKVDLSNVPLAADYAVTPLGSQRSHYQPTAFTSLLFVSDVPKSLTWQDGDTQPVTAPNDLVDGLLKLQGLKELRLRVGLWVVRDVAERIINGMQRLEIVDFRESGMYKGRKWTVEAGRAEVAKRIEEEKRLDKEREERERRQRILLEDRERRRRLTAVY